jgi:hypothetical protein
MQDPFYAPLHQPVAYTSESKLEACCEPTIATSCSPTFTCALLTTHSLSPAVESLSITTPTRPVRARGSAVAVVAAPHTTRKELWQVSPPLLAANSDHSEESALDVPPLLLGEKHSLTHTPSEMQPIEGTGVPGGGSDARAIPSASTAERMYCGYRPIASPISFSLF